MQYYELAAKWVLSDMTYQTNEGPSLPAHQYLIAGQAGGIPNTGNPYGWPANESPWAEAQNPGSIPSSSGCDTALQADSVDMMVNFPATLGNPYVPCQDYETILDRVDEEFGKSADQWRFYFAEPKALWNAPYGVNHIYNYEVNAVPPNPNITIDSTGNAFAQDVAAGNLAALTYIIPCSSWSDHPAVKRPTNTNILTGETGPNWVNFIVNTIGNTSGTAHDVWKNTTIIVVWDNWGGWYDHMSPFTNPMPYFMGNTDPYEFGYRVPLLVISPYLSAPGTVDHYPLVTHPPVPPPRTQASILHYIETTLGLSSLGSTDAASDDLTEMFNYAQSTPLAFSQIRDTYGPFPAGSGDCHEGQDAGVQ